MSRKFSALLCSYLGESLLSAEAVVSQLLQRIGQHCAHKHLNDVSNSLLCKEVTAQKKRCFEPLLFNSPTCGAVWDDRMPERCPHENYRPISGKITSLAHMEQRGKSAKNLSRSTLRRSHKRSSLMGLQYRRPSEAIRYAGVHGINGKQQSERKNNQPTQANNYHEIQGKNNQPTERKFYPVLFPQEPESEEVLQIRLAKEQADKKDKHKQQFLRKMEAEKLIDSQIQTKFPQAVRAVGQKPDKTEKEGNRQSKSRITFRNVQDASQQQSQGRKKHYLVSYSKKTQPKEDQPLKDFQVDLSSQVLFFASSYTKYKIKQ